MDKERSSLVFVLLLSLPLLPLLLCIITPTQQLHTRRTCESPLFVFGASMVDVGQNAAAMPFRSYSEFPPYGIDFFREPASRFSNGRLFIDFITQGLGYDFLDPFLKSVGANFTHGVNFASSGATVCNTSITGDGSSSNGLFSLSVQINQFRRFKSLVMAAQLHGGSRELPSINDFQRGIYFIEMGHNDYLTTAFRSPDYDVNSSVAMTLFHLGQAIEKLYNEGARNIIAMNVLPLGCTPIALGINDPALQDVDEFGCMWSYNNLTSIHNEGLQVLIEELRLKLTSANLVVFDVNSLVWDAVRNSSKYGIKYALKACCGAGGGKYNFKLSVHCGSSGYADGVYMVASKCEEPAAHIFWDSVHPVESFNREIANGFLTGELFRPKFAINELCQPQSLFGSRSSY